MTNYPIRIPERFAELLSNSRCSLLVQQVLEEFSEFIARNEMVFFRQYTDHGPRHIEAVLETASALTSELSQEFLTAEDVCVLVIATILHDSALHLQEPGFLALLSEARTTTLLPELDADSWNVLWARYVSEMGRLSQTQLYDTFGISEPIPAPALENPNSWTPLQFSYIGEFIRRHHHRLAHEMACFGLPGATVDSHLLSRNDDTFRPLVDLSGLVARSHGMAIRPLLPYLERHYHVRTFDGAHPVYLMVLLRIADYLQLQSGRAPGALYRIKRIQSPQSRREWKVHEAIKEILYDQNADPESVEIIVDPKRTSIDVFIRVQEWLKGIQTELDTSWAILGEVFGRYREKGLGLTIRRIRSNIDDTETFGKDAGFVPQRVSFSAADAELLKLLIKPLYGDRPEIAVRELVQNAVDAVRERIALGQVLKKPLSANVEVHVKKHDDGKWSLIVEDFGIGMTFDTLSNFFLNAGASFRSSMVWKKQFQSDDGKSIVLRSGRFGVGALAAFLLADDPKLITLKVSTRHVHASVAGGFEFEAELTDRPLTVRHISRDTPGTRIEVVTSSAPAFMQRSSSDKNDLVAEWDWYCLDEPQVRRVATSGRELTQSVRLPADVTRSPHDYHWIEPEGFQSVGWTYGNAPALVCNGIIVAKDGKSAPLLEETETGLGKTAVRLPSISVFDPNGKLPLTLDRLRVDFERISFLDSLREDVLRNIGAYLAVCAPGNLRESRDFDITKRQDLRSHPAISNSIKQIPWVLTPKGISLFDPELLSQLGVNRIVEVKHVGDISLINTTAQADQFAVAVTPKSIWDLSKKNDKVRAITGAKRGMYRERMAIDSVDERRLERAVDLLSNSRRWNSEKSYNEVPTRTGRLVRNVVEFFDDNTIRKKQISPREFYREFERQVFRIREILWRIGKDEGENEGILRDVMRRLERRLDNSEEVTPGMQEAYSLLKEVTAKNQPLSVMHHIRRAADALDDSRVDNRELSSREAMRVLERANDRLGELRQHPLIQEIFYRLEDVIRDISYRDQPLPKPLLEVVRTIESISPRESKNFEMEGEIAAPVIQWKALSQSTELTDDWSVAEYEIDQSVQIGSVTGTLARIWRDIIGQPVIPYDLEERKGQLMHLWARQDMKRHLQHWESVLENAKLNKK